MEGPACEGRVPVFACLTVIRSAIAPLLLIIIDPTRPLPPFHGNAIPDQHWQIRSQDAAAAEVQLKHADTLRAADSSREDEIVGFPGRYAYW